jgi:hypothetical protein
MAGPLIKNAILPQNPQNNPSGFRSRNLVEASVTVMGKVYRTSIREGATADNLIEKIAKENDGWVSKKFYPEFNTSEIIAVKIGGQLLVKSTEAGIHFSLGPAGIPMAVTAKQGIVFPNAEELRIGKLTSNIALWTTGSNLDFSNLGGLSRHYSGSGGIKLSADALKKVSAAHGGSRSEKLLKEDNILVLNKDTGEILTAAQNAHAPELFPSIQCESIFQVSNPAVQQNDGFTMNDASIFQIQYLTVRPFEGRFMDLVKVQYKPLPYDGIAAEKIPVVPLVPDLIAPMDSGRMDAIGKCLDPNAPIFVPIRFAQVELPDVRLSNAQQPGSPKSHGKPVAMDAIRAWMEPRSEPLMIQTGLARVHTQKKRAPFRLIESEKSVKATDAGKKLEKPFMLGNDLSIIGKKPADSQRSHLIFQNSPEENIIPSAHQRKKRKKPRLLVKPALVEPAIPERRISSKMKKHPKPKADHVHPKAKPKLRNDHPYIKQKTKHERPKVKPPREKIKTRNQPRTRKIPTDSAPKVRQPKERAAKNMIAKRDRAIKRASNPVHPEIRKIVKKNKTLDSKKKTVPDPKKRRVSSYHLNEMLGLYPNKSRKRISGRAMAGN